MGYLISKECILEPALVHLYHLSCHPSPTKVDVAAIGITFFVDPPPSLRWTIWYDAG